MQVDGELHAANVTDSTNGALNASANHGIEVDLGHKHSVMDGIIMECMGTSTSIIKPAGDDSKLVNVPVSSEPKQVETNFSTPLPVHVTGINQIGLQENKPRPTWTRLARMEFGPRGNDGDFIKPMLGKRGLHELEDDSNVGTESKEHKRGRRETEIQTSETAGVLEHPCRAQ